MKKVSLIATTHILTERQLNPFLRYGSPFKGGVRYIFASLFFIFLSLN